MNSFHAAKAYVNIDKQVVYYNHTIQTSRLVILFNILIRLLDYTLLHMKFVSIPLKTYTIPMVWDGTIQYLTTGCCSKMISHFYTL